MTQAQIDLQTQLEQAIPTDLMTRPLLNDSPVFYTETSEQTPPTFLEPMEHTKVEHENSKPTPSQDDTDHTKPIPPPPKKRYELMKDPIFLSSPIYPPTTVLLYIFNLILSSFLHFLCFRNIYSSSSSIHILSEHPHFSFFALFQPSSSWLQMLKQTTLLP